MSSPCRVEMLGQLRVVGPEEIATHFEMRRSALLLAYLAFYPHRQHARESLAELLWPEEDPAVTRVRFRQVLAGARRSLESAGIAPDSALIADATHVRVNPVVVTSDVLEFEALLSAAHRETRPEAEAALLQQATALYRGELLPGYYDEWISLERHRLAGAAGDALVRLSELQRSLGNPTAAQEAALAAVRLDPLREDAHAALIRALAASGRRAEAQRQLKELERMLREELGASVDPALRELVSTPPSTPPPSAGPSGIPRPPVAQPDAGAPRETCPLEPVGGAVPLSSPLYVVRPADGEFAAAIRHRDSIVLVKGPRQVGKTSLLARGVAHGRLAGARVVLTDFQKLPSGDLQSPDHLFRALILAWCDQLELEIELDQVWSPLRSWAANWERFIRREVLRAGHRPLLWAMDEVDRLFTLPYGSEIFGLFRSWHNERSLDPGSPWSELTLAIAYATEAHLFISDLNQSPFNVGTRVTLDDFTPEQVGELNRRHGGVLRSASELERFVGLAGGHPYLVRRGLFELAAKSASLDSLLTRAVLEDGPFGDHLRRLRLALSGEPELYRSVLEHFRQRCELSPDHYYRLRAAGVVIGDSPREARPRCGLYAEYLARFSL